MYSSSSAITYDLEMYVQVSVRACMRNKKKGSCIENTSTKCTGNGKIKAAVLVHDRNEITKLPFVIFIAFSFFLRSLRLLPSNSRNKSLLVRRLLKLPEFDFQMRSYVFNSNRMSIGNRVSSQIAAL